MPRRTGAARDVHENAAIRRTLPGLMASFDEEARITDYQVWDPGYLRPGVDSPIGKQPSQVMPKEIGERVEFAVREALAAEIPIETGFQITEDISEPRFYECVASPLPQRRIMAMVRDVTRSIALEQKLESINRTLRALTEINKAMVRASDEQTFLRDVCEIVVRTCGASFRLDRLRRAGQGQAGASYGPGRFRRRLYGCRGYHLGGHGEGARSHRNRHPDGSGQQGEEYLDQALLRTMEVGGEEARLCRLYRSPPEGRGTNFWRTEHIFWGSGSL